jgi:hypothetical protein
MPIINKDQFISIIQGASDFNITLPDLPAERVTEPNPEHIGITLPAPSIPVFPSSLWCKSRCVSKKC